MRRTVLFLLMIFYSYLLSAQVATRDTVPGTNIFYESRADVLNAPDCNPSEVYIKKKVQADMARHFENYPQIAVDFISFKGQNGYNDKKNQNRIIYPFEIKMFVYIRRKIIKEGKEYHEVQTWKYESIYEYATKPRSKCEFYSTKASDAKLVSTELYKLQ